MNWGESCTKNLGMRHLDLFLLLDFFHGFFPWDVNIHHFCHHHLRRICVFFPTTKLFTLKVNWWFGYLGTPPSNNPFHKGILPRNFSTTWAYQVGFFGENLHPKRGGFYGAEMAGFARKQRCSTQIFIEMDQTENTFWWGKFLQWLGFDPSPEFSAKSLPGRSCCGTCSCG